MTRVAAVGGVPEQANGFHEREVGALGLFRDLGDRHKEAEILTHLRSWQDQLRLQQPTAILEPHSVTKLFTSSLTLSHPSPR